MNGRPKFEARRFRRFSWNLRCVVYAVCIFAHILGASGFLYDTEFLITGVAGYIGSHAALFLLQQGAQRVVGIDNLSRGSTNAVTALQDAFGNDFVFIYVDVGDKSAMKEKVFSRFDIGAVLHFASVNFVGESALHPALYHHKITANTQSIYVGQRPKY